MQNFANSWEPQIVGISSALHLYSSFWRGFVYVYAVALIPYFLINHDRYGKGFLTLVGLVKCFTKRFGIITQNKNRRCYQLRSSSFCAVYPECVSRTLSDVELQNR
jgi:hypothetical protein